DQVFIRNHYANKHDPPFIGPATVVSGDENNVLTLNTPEGTTVTRHLTDIHRYVPRKAPAQTSSPPPPAQTTSTPARTRQLPTQIHATEAKWKTKTMDSLQHPAPRRRFWRRGHQED